MAFAASYRRSQPVFCDILFFMSEKIFASPKSCFDRQQFQIQSSGHWVNKLDQLVVQKKNQNYIKLLNFSKLFNELYDASRGKTLKTILIFEKKSDRSFCFRFELVVLLQFLNL